MKKLVFFLLVPFLAQSQVTSYTAYVWDVRPDSICPGDSLTVLYKINPTVNIPTIPGINLTIGTNTVWTGTGSYLKSRPKEKWPTTPDSVFILTIKTPTDLLVGAQVVKFNTSIHSGTITGTVAVKNCSCTISTSFTSMGSDLATTLTAITTGSNSGTVYNWDFGFGWQAGASVQSYTFGSAGTYTVGLNVVNPTCQDTYTASVTVYITTTTVGITEYELNEIPPVYFDIYGNKTEKKAGIILIEQRGTIFRKILIQ